MLQNPSIKSFIPQSYYANRDIDTAVSHYDILFTLFCNAIRSSLLCSFVLSSCILLYCHRCITHVTLYDITLTLSNNITIISLHEKETELCIISIFFTKRMTHSLTIDLHRVSRKSVIELY
jgi:hypothetical protein